MMEQKVNRKERKVFLILNTGWCAVFGMYILKIGPTFISIYESMDVAIPTTTKLITNSYIIFFLLIPVMILKEKIVRGRKNFVNMIIFLVLLLLVSPVLISVIILGLFAPIQAL